jgi:tetratricopeptide (TPR) repeat protein
VVIGAVMDPAIFISHSSKDQKVSRTICSALENRGLHCWIYSRNIKPGQNFQEQIVKAIRAAKIMVLVFTNNANNSNEIKKELALASQNNLVVIPVRVEDVTPNEAFAYEFATRQWIDLFDNWENSIGHLVELIAGVIDDHPSVLAKDIRAGDAGRSAPLFPTRRTGMRWVYVSGLAVIAAAAVAYEVTTFPRGQAPASATNSLGAAPQSGAPVASQTAASKAPELQQSLQSAPSASPQQTEPVAQPPQSQPPVQAASIDSAAPSIQQTPKLAETPPMATPAKPVQVPQSVKDQCHEGFSKRVIVACTTWISLDPNNPLPYQLRGDEYLYEKSFDKAVADYSKGLSLVPNDRILYAYRSQAYYGTQNYKAALADANKVISLASYGQAYLERGGIYEQMGQREQAIADYRKAISLDPTENSAVDALKRLGEIPY